MMIDLMQFCSKDPARPYVHTPFTHGDRTYATNGHILVSVPRRDDVVPRPHAVSEKGVLRVFKEAAYCEATLDLSGLKLPTANALQDCPGCDGSGVEHECPDCKCTCLVCQGVGEVSEKRHVNIGGVQFDADYVAKIAALPGAAIAPAPKEGSPCAFAFDGGFGAVMPIREGQNIIGDIHDFLPKQKVGAAP